MKFKQKLKASKLNRQKIRKSVRCMVVVMFVIGGDDNYIDGDGDGVSVDDDVRGHW